MQTKLKRSLPSLLLLAASVTLTACGGGNKPAAAPAKEGSSPARAEGRPSGVGLSGEARGLYDDGWKAWQAGDLPTAKKKFEAARDAEPKSAAPAYSLGVVLEQLGDPAAAQQAYRSALSANPAHEPSMCAYALSVAGSGRLTDAETFLAEKRSKRRESPRLATCSAEVKSLANDHAGAQQLAQDALRMDPDFKDAMVTIARDHYRARKLDLAKYALQAILEGFGEASPARDKDNAEARLLRGLVFREAGARAVALADFEAVASRRPDLVEALINLGSMRLEAGNAADAQAVLESATRFAPTSAIAHLNLGDCYRLLGRYADAKREFELALSRDSSLAAAHYDMGLMYLTAPTIPGNTADSQVATAIKELEAYRRMRGPKAPPGVEDDIDDLIARAKAKQAELRQTPAAPAPGGGAAGGAGPAGAGPAGKK